MNKFSKNLILSVASTGALVLVNNAPVYADCVDNGQYGQTCTEDQSYEIVKEVRLVGTDDWKDRITNVKEGAEVEFRVRVYNRGDVEVDDMEMKDILPSEMYRTGGDDLKETWNDFSAGERQTFIIRAKVDSNEYDQANFEKCVVNKAEIRQDGDFKGSDTATVCYENREVALVELPETGAPNAALVFAGSIMTFLGGLVKRSTKKVK